MMMKEEQYRLLLEQVKGRGGEVAAVLDIDSKSVGTFNDTDRLGLEAICGVLGPFF
jgi:putative methionine-R-sulfoxide reductase with GAF domain